MKTLNNIPKIRTRVNRIFTQILTILVICLPLILKAQTDVGTGKTYTSLKAAFDAINAGTLSGNVVLRITSSITNNNTARLNASGTGSANYSSVTIYPASSGIVLSGGINAAIIALDGADNVVIDGRPNMIGTSIGLTITNTNTGGASSVVQFINSASNNTIRYSKFTSAENNTATGIVYFLTSSTGTGNDNNIIEYNELTGTASGRPVNLIYSSGTAGRENSGNIIRYNKMYDFIRTSNASNGIYVFSNSTEWTIIGNSFYETTNFVSGWTIDYEAIRVENASGGGFLISDNYIGGSAEKANGTWVKTNSRNNPFYGIYINVGNANVSTIKNNTIRNFSWGNSSSALWTAIHIQAGSVNIDSNIIGNPSLAGSVSVVGGASGTIVSGINILGTGNINCRNNYIGSITSSNVSTNASTIYGINNGSTGTVVISNNVIGSDTLNNSINAASSSTSNAQSVYGIYNSGTGSVVIQNNIIANLNNGTTNTTVGTLGVINGITSTAGTNTISSNIIHDLSINNLNNSSSNTASIIGIALTGSSLKNVNGNTIYSLSNPNTSFAGSMMGIYFTGNASGNVVSGNFIRDLTVKTNTGSSKISGIFIASGVSSFYNNIINIFNNKSTVIYGIYEAGTAGQSCNIYFNTVYLSGNTGSGSTNKSYALYCAGTSNTRIIRNNIFDNSRTTTGVSSLHYSVFYAGTSNLTSDYNNYHVGLQGLFGKIGAGSDLSSLASLRNATAQDANSLDLDPSFYDVADTSAYGMINLTSLPGVAIVGITTDYIGNARAATPSMGAWDGINKWKGSVSNDFGNARNWTKRAVPNSGENIIFDENPSNHCYLDTDRIVGNIENNQSVYYIKSNGNSLTINGSIIGKLDLTSAPSTIVFKGSSLQTIPSNTFIDNHVYNIVINNSKGITIGQDFTVINQLTLTNGIINTGSNTLSIHDGGSIVGADSTKYINGKLSKIGNTDFTFPVGNNGKYAPISISAPANISDEIVASYVNRNADSLYSTSSMGVGLDHVSTCEYWVVNQVTGTSTGKVSLSWDNVRSCGVTNTADLVVARWDGSKWVDAGNSASLNKSAGSGVETLGGFLDPDLSFDYTGIYTLASVSAENPLPVELLSFTGECEDGNIKFQWSTAAEINNDYFTIEQSSDMVNWQDLAKIKGAGNSNSLLNYNYTAYEQKEDKMYYRLKQTDFDGTTVIVGLVSIEKCNNMSGIEVSIYPNPSNGEFSVNSNTSIQKIKISDLCGKEIYNNSQLDASSFKVNISEMPKGVYVAMIESGKLIVNQKLVVR